MYCCAAFPLNAPACRPSAIAVQNRSYHIMEIISKTLV